MYSGYEHLLSDGIELPYSMIDFWKTNLSEILLNVTRGSFAEFVVQCALTDGGFDALHQEKTGMEAWDIDGPEIYAPDLRPSRIEVKSCASLQYNSSYVVERKQDSQLSFSIRKATDFSGSDDKKRRNNDLYVFCHYTALSKSDNILDLKFWDFYVCPTYRIDNDDFLKDRNSVSLWRLKHMGLQKCSFSSLYGCITDVLTEIEDWYANEKSQG